MLLRIPFSHTRIELGRGSLRGLEDYYCPLVFASVVVCFSWAYIQRLTPTEHLERQKRVGSVSSYRNHLTEASVKVWVLNTERERMRCPFVPLHTPSLCSGAYINTWEKKKSIKMCQTYPQNWSSHKLPPHVPPVVA